MAIRTFSSRPTARTLPMFLSARAWPGLRSWLLSVLATSLVFSALAAFAWRGETHRLPDFTTFLITIPIGTLVVVLVLAFLWRILADIPVASGLAFLARALPAAWIVPLVDILRSAGSGFVVTTIPFDAPGYLLAAFTATLLPAEIPIPLAIRAGILAAALIAGFVVWFSRGALIRSIVAAVFTSAMLVKMIFFPAALGLWQGFLRGEGLVAGAGALGREAIIAVTNGYWWLNIYERFPTAVDAQAASALRLATAGYTVLGLGLLSMVYALWLIPSVRHVLRHSFRSWSSLHVAVYALAGAVAGIVFGTTTASFQGNWWVAFFIGALLLFALRFHFALERCLFRASADQKEGICQPITDGHLSPTLARDLSVASGVFALLAAWVLGWPIFSAILAALAASALSRHSLWSSWPWTATVFRAAGAASLALAGFFFASQNARLVVPAISIALIAALYQAGAEVFTRKTPKS